MLDMVSRRKSNLTEDQLELLIKHLRFYQDLDSGNRDCTTEAQKDFVEVVRVYAKTLTEHEAAYLAYKRDRKNADIDLRSLRVSGQRLDWSGEGKQRSQADEKPTKKTPRKSAPGRASGKASKKSKANQTGAVGILGSSGSGRTIKSPTPKKENSYVRYVKEPWGTREAWARDRGSWKKSH